MHRRDFLRSMSLGAAAITMPGCLIAASSTSASGQKPNIVLILADDMGYGDMSKNNPESKIQTPNIDKLASLGMLFTDGHSTAAICTPTRYSLLTGRYYWRTNTYKRLGWKVVTPGLEPLIEPNRLTLPKMLKQKGYHSACIGKWHLGFNWQFNKSAKKKGDKKKGDYYSNLDYSKPVGGGPVTRGFDYFFGFDTPNSSYCFIENDQHTEIPTEAFYYKKTRKMAKGWTYEKILPTLTEKAVAYIDEQSKTDTPFFLYFPLSAPHTPIAPSKEFIGKSEAGAYGDFVCQIDWTVGKVLDALKRNDLDQNTIVIFTSDNGSPERDGRDYYGKLKSIARFNHKPNGKFRGMKADLWEGGHRVPLIVKWPGITKPNSISNNLVSQVDIMRTIAFALNINLPLDAAEDSFNILPALAGEDTVVRDNLITYDGKIPCVRLGKWKLISDKGATGFSKQAGYRAPKDAPDGQLYDMVNDPYETSNLYNEKPEIVARLQDYVKKAGKEGRTYFKPVAGT